MVSRSEDVTWDNVPAATWSSVELNVGIICACCPTLKPVIAWAFPRLLTPTTRLSSSRTTQRTGHTGTSPGARRPRRRSNDEFRGVITNKSAIESHASADMGYELDDFASHGRNGSPNTTSGAGSDYARGIHVRQTLQQEVKITNESGNDVSMAFQDAERRV